MNVVSFFAPRRDHPLFQDYTPFLALLRESCQRFGHHHLVLTDDPTVAKDAYVRPLPRSLMQAVTAAQYAYLSDPDFADTPTLLTGADCVLANDPQVFAEECGDADIVITVGPFSDCRMNTGAIYIPRPAAVARVWADTLAMVGDAWGADQVTLYASLLASGLKIKELPVDPFNLAPDNPGDDCRRGVVLHFRGPRKGWMLSYCKNWLDIGPGVTAVALPNSDDGFVFANVAANSRLGLPEVDPLPAHDGHAVLVGGGPSLADTLPEIIARKNNGQIIFALNGAAEWLMTRGVRPDFGVILDARPVNAKFVIAGIPWLLASQCHPTVVKKARHVGEDVRLWHFAMKGIADYLPEREPPQTLIGGGLTVGLCAMGLAFALGYRALHLYGYDSSYRGDQTHSYTQPQTDPEKRLIEAWCGSERFDTNIAMYAQAEAFPRWAETLADEGAIITVHGDGLLPAVARAMHRATIFNATAEAAAVDLAPAA